MSEFGQTLSVVWSRNTNCPAPMSAVSMRSSAMTSTPSRSVRWLCSGGVPMTAWFAAATFPIGTV